jgi:predicted DNA-binding transcriptional regulator AlpA
LSEKDAARYLGVSRAFLRESRMNGNRRGRTPAPPWVKFGRSVRYDIRDLDKWIAEHKEFPAYAPGTQN